MVAGERPVCMARLDTNGIKLTQNWLDSVSVCDFASVLKLRKSGLNQVEAHKAIHRESTGRVAETGEEFAVVVGELRICEEIWAVRECFGELGLSAPLADDTVVAIAQYLWD